MLELKIFKKSCIIYVMLKVKILLKGERIMKKIKAFKINRILMEMKKSQRNVCDFLWLFVLFGR